MSEKVSSAAASLFDLRTVIAMLFAFYGVVLTIMGIIGNPGETGKSGGLDLNLWTGHRDARPRRHLRGVGAGEAAGRRRAAPRGRRPAAHAPLVQTHDGPWRTARPVVLSGQR